MSTYLCPVCGSPMLQAKMITSISQTPDGEWKMDEYTTDDISSIIEPNVEVYCTNEFCGPPTDPYTGRVISDSSLTGLEVEDPDPLYSWFNYHHMSSRKKFDECTEDEQRAYKEWRNEVYYTPWSGVIGDCERIQRLVKLCASAY